MSVKVSELRIGNLVYGNVGTDAICTITGINKYPNFVTIHASCKLWEYSGISATEDDFNYIPLTDIWLKKLDFASGESGVTMEICWQYNGFQHLHLMPINVGYWAILVCRQSGNETGRINFKIIKYVHELQNLYFALSNEEIVNNDIKTEDTST